jgi:glutathionylspermidine synthase
MVQYDAATVRELQHAAETMDRIFWKAMRFVQRYMPDAVLLRQLGIHPRLLPLARFEAPLHGIARQDWIVNQEGLKLIEYNTDTPTGVPEAAYLAGHVLHHFCETTGIRNLINPSASMDERLRETFAAWNRLYAKVGFSGPIYFTSYDDHLEDRANTEYMMARAAEAGCSVRYVPLSQLQIVPGEGLYANEHRIEMLYRLYPLEYLVTDKDAEGYPIGEALLELVENGLLAIINPSQSILSQSKGMLALIWSLYERNEQMMQANGLEKPLFDEAECVAIKRWMLPAYWSAETFLNSQTPYVSKSFFGREGRGTKLFAGDGMLMSGSEADTNASAVDADIAQYYDVQPQLFQRMEPMHPLQVMTESGMYEGWLLTGVFVVGRKYAGILPRIGGRVTGDLAYFCAAVSNT